MKLRQLCAFGVAFTFILFTTIHLRLTAYPRRRRFASIDHFSPLAGAESEESHDNILVLQHLASESPIHTASRSTHELYAHAWGYRYKADWNNYVTGTNCHESINNIQALYNAVALELGDPRGAEWIFFTQSGTVIADPSVAIHSLLPPGTVKPLPYILGAQDVDGFNTNVLIVRIVPLVLRFLDRVIRLATNLDAAVNDVHHLGNQLRARPDVALHFYEIPKYWFSADDLVDGEGPLGEDSWVPRLQVNVKGTNEADFIPVVEYAGRIIADAAELSGNQNRLGTALSLLPQSQWTEDHAFRWWGSAGSGLESIFFSTVLNP